MSNISLFFNGNKELEELVADICDVVGIKNTQIHLTTFSISGMYYEGQLDDGLSVQIDDNNYDYEDLYKYFLNIRYRKLYMDSDLLSLAREVALKIVSHLKFEVAIELSLRMSDEFDLEIYTFDGGKVVSNTKHFLS